MPDIACKRYRFATFINQRLLLRAMQGTIVNFRSSPTRQHHNHMIVMAEGVGSRQAAEKLIGREVIYKTEAMRDIKGKVAAAHGNKGAIRVIFEKGMPGQSISRKVEVL